MRDHELLDNRVWANTKSGWFDRADMLGFSPVSWSSARDPRRPKFSLDLVAVVPLRSEKIHTEISDGQIVFTWEPPDWFLFPASKLFDTYIAEQSVARQSVPTAVANEYRITASNPLTFERLVEILLANERLPGATPYGVPGEE